MDGREAMAYYMQRGMGGGGGGSGSGTQAGGLHGPADMRLFGGMSLPEGGSSVGHGFSLSVDASMPPHGAGASPASGLPSGESVKKKRGRPRKYGPDGSVSLALSPSSPKTLHSAVAGGSQKRGRGRPPGSGKKQLLASLGMFSLLCVDGNIVS